MMLTNNKFTSKRLVLLVATLVFCGNPPTHAAKQTTGDTQDDSVDEDRVLRDGRITEMHLDRVYLGVGTNELGLDGCPEHPGNTEAVNGIHKLVRILKDHGIDESQVPVTITECTQHSESAWAERLPGAIRFLFGPWSF